MPQLSSKNLCFSFAAEPVLRNINLRCERGEFVSILGASGCGKSTLLRLLTGLISPTSGDVSTRAADGNQASFVFQQPTLCPWLTVSQNIELPLKLRGLARSIRRRSSDEAVEMVGLKVRDKRKLPRQLSGGMQMRVSLARAFVTRPKVMLMDEPFSGLDEVLRQQLCETCLQLWRREAWTTVFVTHNVSEAVFMSQKIFILAGRPATIVDVIEVPFETRIGDLRVSTEFIRLVTDVSQRLRRAVELDDSVAETQ